MDADFDRAIYTYWHCEARDEHNIDDLKKVLRNPEYCLNEKKFGQLLKNAIESKTYTVERYLQLTGLDFESRAEVVQDLGQLYRELFEENQDTK